MKSSSLIEHSCAIVCHDDCHSSNRDHFLSSFMCQIEYVTIHVPNEGYTIYTEDGQNKGITYVDSSSSELQFVTSPWSTKCLVFNEFLYNCHSSHGNKVYWRCHNYSRYIAQD